MFVIVIIIFIIIALLELPGLIKGKQWRELIVFSGLFVFAFIIAFLQSMGIEVPSPIKGIISFLKYIHISY